MHHASAQSTLRFNLAAAAALSTNAVFADSSTLKSSNLNAIGQWYGRAGGLTGSDRVSAPAGHAVEDPPIGITWDAAVAARINQPLDRPSGYGVTVTYEPFAGMPVPGRCFSAQRVISFTTGRSSLPLAVSRYS